MVKDSSYNAEFKIHIFLKYSIKVIEKGVSLWSMEESQRTTALSVNGVKEFSYGERIINKKYTILYKIADEAHSKVYSLSTKKQTKEMIRAIKFVCI